MYGPLTWPYQFCDTGAVDATGKRGRLHNGGGGPFLWGELAEWLIAPAL